jgi:hypothetical protein
LRVRKPFGSAFADAVADAVGTIGAVPLGSDGGFGFATSPGSARVTSGVFVIAVFVALSPGAFASALAAVSAEFLRSASGVTVGARAVVVVAGVLVLCETVMPVAMSIATAIPARRKDFLGADVVTDLIKDASAVSAVDSFSILSKWILPKGPAKGARARAKA